MGFCQSFLSNFQIHLPSSLLFRKMILLKEL
nr:MAG TPA: hypothetical protein [Caudoviricetes sp.]